MLKFLSRAAAALALLFAPAVQAQTRDADPALWVVKDRDTTIYLFGTVHILKPGLSWFDEAVKTAFDKSDQVVLEVVGADDPATMQAAIVRNAIDANGPSVTSQLPEDKRAAYAKALGELGVPATAFDKFKPWFPATMISVGLLPKFGYDPQSGAEQVIAAAAKSAGKPVTALETVDQQFGFFNSLPRESQMVMLERTLDQLPTLSTTLDAMVASWSKGDPKGLARTMNEEVDDTPDMRKALLTDRNARWAGWISDRMKQPGTVFIAVGAGHLAGKGSVQDYLKQHKLKAKRLKY